MWLSLIFKNLKYFIHTKPVIFFFIVISQIICVTASLAAAGMVDAITPVPQDDREYSALSFYIDFIDHSNKSYEPIRCVCIFDLKEKKFLYIGENNSEAEKIRKNARNPISETESYWELGGGIEEGNSDTVGYLGTAADDEWMKQYRPYLYGNGNKIQIARNKYYESKYQNLIVGDNIKICNTEYTVSKIIEKTMEPPDISTFIQINAKSIDDQFTVHWIAFTLKNETDQNGIARVNDAIRKNFGDMSPKIDEPQPPPLMEKQFNNMIYVLVFIMILVVLLNVSRLYSYIMSTRVKALAVYSLCGSSKIKLFVIFLSEIILLLLISFIFGTVLFQI